MKVNLNDALRNNDRMDALYEAEQIWVSDGVNMWLAGNARARAGYEYWIALDRCDTAEKILSWVIHLEEKTWVTPEIIGSFVLVAAMVNKVSHYHA